MRSCKSCHAAVPDDAETCPQCGTLVTKGILASFFGMFRAKPLPTKAVPPKAPRARDAAGAFRMKVEDIFTISGRGTVVTGQIASGDIRIGDEVSFVSTKGVSMKSNITGIEMFQKVVDVAKAGDRVGLLLRGVRLNDIPAGTTIESV
ncbi:MAG: EF-Tu/IF-2/RF-3 family GTPase [Vicinamibacteria bacterium]